MKKTLRATGILALAPYLVLSQTAFPVAAGSTDIGQKSRMMIAEAKTADSSYAASGVKLLHEIFQKLRNSNQLALNNPTKQLANATQTFAGSLDPLLAIRPAEKSLNKNQSLAYASQDKKVYSPRGFAEYGAGKETATKKKTATTSALNSAMNSMPSGLGGATNGTISAISGATNGTIPGSLPQVNIGANVSNARRDGARDYLSSVNSPAPAAKVAAAAPSTSARGSLKRGLVLDREREVATASAGSDSPSAGAGASVGGLSPQNSQALAKSVSRLMQSTRQLSELSQASENSIRTYGSAKSEIRDERTVSTQAGGPVIQEYGMGRSTKDDFAATTANKPSMEPGDNQYSNSPLMTPNQPGQFQYIRNQLIALLPPSVVGGIPAARLGATEQELAATINQKNTATKQSIDGWSIWTFKSQNGHTAAVQLYMRHKVLEAIRVFQPTYLGEEVGIKIGDDLQSIKTKFGEPAFILSEPDLGKGTPSQNYVYPISHVAFQLSRSKTQKTPQVVSVLIFDMQ